MRYYINNTSIKNAIIYLFVWIIIQYNNIFGALNLNKLNYVCVILHYVYTTLSRVVYNTQYWINIRRLWNYTSWKPFIIIARNTLWKFIHTSISLPNLIALRTIISETIGSKHKNIMKLEQWVEIMSKVNFIILCSEWNEIFIILMIL